MAFFKRIWTDEKIEQLKGYVKQELKYREIGAIMGFSKNAIVGACHRYVDIPPKRQERVVKIIHPRKERNQSISFPKYSDVRYKERAHKSKTVTFPTMGCCKYIIGEPKNLRCCGSAHPLGKSFCAHHAKLIYVAPATRKG